MTENRRQERQEVAKALGTDTDPLAKHEQTLENIGEGKPFEMFLDDRIRENGKKPKTVKSYERVIQQYREYMNRQDRHPACPSKDHIKGFALNYCRDERGNSAGVVKEKLWQLGKVYNYWKNDSMWPHPLNYDPIASAREEMDLSGSTPKDPPELPLSDLRRFVQEEITNIRDRAIIVSQLKLGLRASEVCNIELRDLHINKADLLDHYPEMGTHSRLNSRENAIYIPPRDGNDLGVSGRPGNKSNRPRILPLDSEMQRVLLDYLLIRPDVNGRPWLFLSKTNLTQLRDDKTVNRIWKEYFRPEYGPTETNRGITSHFGRHYFTSHWRVREDAPEELVK